VTGTGTGNITYQWQKKKVDLTDDDRISGATSSTLQITNVDVADAGLYRCVVTAECGSSTSNEAVLSFGPPHADVDFDGDGDVDLEDFGVFQTCLTEPGEPIGGAPCDLADLNSDGIVDGYDLPLMKDCLSGPGCAAAPHCIGQ